MRQIIRLVAAPCLALAACSQSTSTGTGTAATVAFNVATRPATSSALDVSGATDTITDGVNTLVIDTAQLVIRDIRLHKVVDSTCSDSTGHNGNDSTEHRGGDDIKVLHDHGSGSDDCDELRVGPFLLDLPLGSGPARQFSVDVPAGSYREVGFKVHAVSSSTEPTFAAQHPELQEQSVRVVGSWGGTPFVFVASVEAEQESEFSPPLVVAESGGTNLTLLVDLSSWFLVNGVLVDPSTANDGQANASAVRGNIKTSIRAFEDHDRDGQDDNHEHDGTGHH
jgi:hypothetical protein